MDLLTLVR